jgi:hypothetical protein
MSPVSLLGLRRNWKQGETLNSAGHLASFQASSTHVPTGNSPIQVDFYALQIGIPAAPGFSV